MDLPGYDAWLEAPYQRQTDFGDCPDCGCALAGDTRNREVWCDHCDWSDAFDWEALAEARAEAAAERAEERYGF